MKELEVGDRFLLPYGDDGRFFYDFICMNTEFGYCDFERRSDHKNVIFKEVKE